MAENLPRYAVTDLIARVSGMSRGRLEMRLLGECAEVSRFMPPQTAGEGDMAFLTNAAYAEAMKASRASLLIMREQDVEALFGSDEPGRAVLVNANGHADYRRQEFSMSDLRYSTGIGVAWISPLGPLKFSLAFPLNEKEGDKTQRFQFQIGTGF